MLLGLRICRLVRKTLSGFKKQLRNRQETAQDCSVYMGYNKDVKGSKGHPSFMPEFT